MAVAAAAAVACVSLVAATAQAGASTGTKPVTKLRVNMSVQRFAVDGNHVIARGPVVAKAIKPDGTTKTVRKRVRLQVQTTDSCTILDLHLGPLFLNLLGLEVRTSDINLTITGNRNEGVLGQLFCSLSRGINLGRPALARRSARSLNDRLEKRPLRFFALHVPVRAAQHATSTGSTSGPLMREQAIPVPSGECEVLDLVLGPLHLDLLGLIVDLYGANPGEPVEVLVTGNPNGGILGSLLCGLAGPPAP